MDFTVMIDIHGAPGSQNGWEETGLVGAVGFIDNTTNTDRTLNVLKNLTQEFTKEIYGGVVKNIELLNEPLFSLDLQKQFNTQGANVVGAANSSGINTTIHDGFYQPFEFENYDPWDASASSPALHLTIDTHQFWAFPPLNDLTKEQTYEKICEFGTQLKAPNSGIPPTLVGEWSLSTGITGNSTSNVEDDQDKRTWFRTLFESQNAAFTPNGEGQASIGWYFWAWKTEYDIDAWAYRRGVRDGYIPANVSDPSTYIFPINSTGCIDPTIKYQANATVTPIIFSPTGTATSSAIVPVDTYAGITSTPGDGNHKDSGSPAVVDYGSISWLAIAPLVLFAFGMCI